MSSEKVARWPQANTDVAVHALHVAWDIRERAPQLLERLEAEVPQLTEVLSAMALGCVTARSCLPFSDKDCVRPVGHARSICVSLSGGGCIVFKGSEPLSRDYLQTFERAQTRRAALDYSPIEHFVLRSHLRAPPAHAIPAHGLRCAERCA